MISPTTKRFLSLIERFVEGELSEKAFTKEYLALFKRQDQPILPEAEFRPIENVFFALDEYHPDPQLSQIPEEQFQAEVREALEELHALDQQGREK